jgi:hypothetical protein
MWLLNGCDSIEEEVAEEAKADRKRYEFIIDSAKSRGAKKNENGFLFENYYDKDLDEFSYTVYDSPVVGLMRYFKRRSGKLIYEEIGNMREAKYTKYGVAYDSLGRVSGLTINDRSLQHWITFDTVAQSMKFDRSVHPTSNRESSKMRPILILSQPQKGTYGKAAMSFDER